MYIYIYIYLSVSFFLSSSHSYDFSPICTLTLAIRSNGKHHGRLLMFDPLLLLPMGIADSPLSCNLIFLSLSSSRCSLLPSAFYSLYHTWQPSHLHFFDRCIAVSSSAPDRRPEMSCAFFISSRAGTVELFHSFRPLHCFFM